MKKCFSLLLMFGFSLMIPFLSQAETIVLTGTSPDATITAGSDTVVYGTAGANSITLESGAKAELLNFSGSNTITILSTSSLFMVSRSGATVTFEGSDGTVLKIPATSSVQTIVFTDKTLILNIYNNQVMLDDQVIGLGSDPIASTLPGGIKSLAVGAAHTAFVKADGSLWTFGENGEGQLGIGNIVDQSSPVNIGGNYKVNRFVNRGSTYFW